VVSNHASGLRSWSAGIEGASRDRALLVVDGDNLTGRITDGGSVYEIRPVGKGVAQIREIDPAAFAPEADPVDAGVTGEAFPAVRAAAGAATLDTVDAIRVLIVYTPAAAAASPDIEAAAQLAVDVANDAYASSAMA